MQFPQSPTSCITVTVTPLEASAGVDSTPRTLPLRAPIRLPQQPVPVAQLAHQQQQQQLHQQQQQNAPVIVQMPQQQQVLPQQQVLRQQQVIINGQPATILVPQPMKQEALPPPPPQQPLVIQQQQRVVMPPQQQQQHQQQRQQEQRLISVSGAESLIKEQQRKIEELQNALESSQNQLAEQARILMQQQSQLNEANNNPSTPSGAASFQVSVLVGLIQCRHCITRCSKCREVLIHNPFFNALGLRSTKARRKNFEQKESTSRPFRVHWRRTLRT